MVPNILLAFLDCVWSWCFQKTVNVDPKVSFLGHDFQFRAQEMWFRILSPWHIILHLFTLKLENLISPENSEISPQTSTPNHWYKYWMKPVLTLIYGESAGDAFPPRKWICFPSSNLTYKHKKKKQNKQKKNTFLVTMYFTEFDIKTCQGRFQTPNILCPSYTSYLLALQNLLKHQQIFGGVFLSQKPFWFFSNKLCLSRFSLYQWFYLLILTLTDGYSGKKPGSLVCSS